SDIRARGRPADSAGNAQRASCKRWSVSTLDGHSGRAGRRNRARFAGSGGKMSHADLFEDDDEIKLNLRLWRKLLAYSSQYRGTAAAFTFIALGLAGSDL